MNKLISLIKLIKKNVNLKFKYEYRQFELVASIQIRTPCTTRVLTKIIIYINKI